MHSTPFRHEDTTLSIIKNKTLILNGQLTILEMPLNHDAALATKRGFMSPTAIIASACALSFLSGCASIVSGTNQTLTVETPGCAGATCKLTNDKGNWAVTTPGSVVVNRAYGPLAVVCSKDGFPNGTANITSTTKGMAFGNILFGGLIGAGVDAGTGAAYDYPNSIMVPMACAK